MIGAAAGHLVVLAPPHPPTPRRTAAFPGHHRISPEHLLETFDALLVGGKPFPRVQVDRVEAELEWSWSSAEGALEFHLQQYHPLVPEQAIKKAELALYHPTSGGIFTDASASFLCDGHWGPRDAPHAVYFREQAGTACFCGYGKPGSRLCSLQLIEE